MRVLAGVFTCFVLLTVVAIISADDSAPWFDLEKCAFCKELGAEEGLIDHMHAEYHNLKNGLLWVTTIDEGHKEAFVRAQQAMTKVGEEMQKTGQIPYMCQHCQNYGDFMMSGVAMECLETGVGYICMMTSDDPEMVKRLQTFGQRNTEEMKKFHEARAKN